MEPPIKRDRVTRIRRAEDVLSAEQVLTQAHAFVEDWLARVLPTDDTSPTHLHRAMRDAVFPGGRRARPLLCRLIADSYGNGDDELVGRMSAAVELVHCASLVQDDLPCFDSATTRRGRPACHVVFGEATAILVGDALLTLAFETLSNTPVRNAATALRLIGVLASATGSSNGIIGGQALELEPLPIDLAQYHRQKTAVLFRAAAAGGAICCGERDVSRWARIGEMIGHALQLRDDVDDMGASEHELGKPVGRDVALCRPNAVLRIGIQSTQSTRTALVESALELIGSMSPETEALRMLIEEATRPNQR